MVIVKVNFLESVIERRIVQFVESLGAKMSSVPALTLSNGVKMPILGFGTWQAKDDELEAALDHALTCGYRHIDTAYVYQNEHVVGKVLKRWIDSGKVKREDLFIVTKLANIGNRESQVEKFINLSLSKLQLSYVDLYLIHTPFGLTYIDDDTMIPFKPDGEADIDFSTDLVAVWKKMEEQVDAGKAKSIGVSNFNVKQVEKILNIARIPPVTNQVELHVYLQQKELEDYLKKKNITLTAYSPLGSAGTVKFLKDLGVTRELPSLLNNSVVQQIAKEVQKTEAQVLLRHIIQRGIAAIPKSTNPERIKQNFNIFDFELNADQMSRLYALNENVRILQMKDIFKGIENHPEYPF